MTSHSHHRRHDRRPTRQTQPPIDDEDLNDLPPDDEDEDEEDIRALMTSLDRRHPATALDKPPKSLPVLAAFQEFIDEERRRSTNRMLILGGFFLLVLVAVIGAGALVGTLFFRNMRTEVRDEVRDVRQNFHELEKSANEAKLDVKTAVAHFEGKAEGLRYYMEQQEKSMQKARESLETRDRGYQSRIDELQRVIATLETENKSLKGDIVDLKADIPAAITQKLELAIGEFKSRIREEMHATATQTADAQPAPLPVPAPAPAAPMPGPVTMSTPMAKSAPSTAAADDPRPIPLRNPSEPDTLSMVIIPRGHETRVNWQLPIPE